MKKKVIILFLGLICFQAVKAQKQDTISTYMANGNIMVNTKDSADYILQVIMPPDSSKGFKINSFMEYYKTGKPKMFGSAIITINGQRVSFYYDGPVIRFFPNGHKFNALTYAMNMPKGNIRNYYPNGHLYSVTRYEKRFKLLECRDSTGNILTQNGNGKWIKFIGGFKHGTEEGMVKDSLEEGTWTAYDNDSAKYTKVYRHGYIISSTKPGWIDQIFTTVDEVPWFKNGGAAGFDAFLAKNVVLPDIDRRIGTKGKALVTFIVEKDGSLTNIRVLRSPSISAGYAVAQAIKKSPPWIPGTQNGIPVRVQYTIAFAFSLAGKE